jgi:hypothetical protein
MRTIFTSEKTVSYVGAIEKGFKQCCGSASLSWGSDLSLWCGSGFDLQFDADSNPTFKFDAYRIRHFNLMRIRILPFTLTRIRIRHFKFDAYRIRHFNLMRIRILPFTLMRIRIWPVKFDVDQIRPITLVRTRILLLITVFANLRPLASRLWAPMGQPSMAPFWAVIAPCVANQDVFGPPGSGSISPRYGSGIGRYGSVDPDPYQNVTDPQHWLLNVN